MNTRLVWLGLLLSTALVACPQPPTPVVIEPSTPTVFKPTLLGSVTIDFDRGAKTAKAHFDRSLNRTTFVDTAQLQFAASSFSVTDDIAGNNHFLNTTVGIVNNSASDLSNLTLVAFYKKATPNVSGSAFSNIQNFGAVPVIGNVLKIKPAHGMQISGLNVVVDDIHADMQAFTPSEISTLQSEASATGLVTGNDAVLGFGYVARNNDAPNGRLIRHTPTASTNSVTIGLKVPAADDPAGAFYRYSMTFLVFTDSVTRVTESLEEQAASGVVARAPLGAIVAYLCGSSLTSGTFIPGAKTAGVGSDITAYLGGNFKITNTTAFGYTAIGNTPTNVTTPAGTVLAASGVLNHYASLDGTGTLSASAGVTVGTAGAATVASDGGFDLNPTAGARGAQNMTYRVTGATDGGGTCTSSDQTADVTISNVVWYVKNNTVAPFLGIHAHPFQNLVDAQTNSAAGDYIYVYAGDGGITNQNAGIILKANQKLIGEIMPLSVGSVSIFPAGTARAKIGHSGGIAVQLATDNDVEGFDITSNGGAGIQGSNFGIFNANTNSVIAINGAALDLSTGEVHISFNKLSSSGAVNGLILNAIPTGSLSVSGDAVTAGSGGSISSSGDGVKITDTDNVSLAFMSITSSAGNGINYATSSGSSVLTVKNTSISNAGAKGIQYVMTSTALPRLFLTDSSITGSGQNAVDLSTSGTSGADFSATGTNTFTNNLATHVNVNLNGTGNSTFDVTGATISNPSSGTAGGIDITMASTTATTLAKVRIQNNNIALNNTSGGASGTGIRVSPQGIETVQALISGNTITAYGTWGINAISGNLASRLDATITNNTVSNVGGNGNGLDGIDLESGLGGVGSSTLCINTTGNNSVAINGYDGFYISKTSGTSFIVEGLTTTAAARILAANPLSTVFDNGTVGAIAGTCTSPVF